MKSISKTTLLFGALAMLVSTVPVQAFEQPMPANIQEEIAKKQGFFAKWTQKAKSLRLDALRKELDRHWKKFMACVKSDKGCPRSLVWTIRGILASIIALIGVTTLGFVAEKVGPTKGWAGRIKAAAGTGTLGHVLTTKEGLNWITQGKEKEKEVYYPGR